MNDGEIEDEVIVEKEPIIIGDEDVCRACGAYIEDGLYVQSSPFYNSWSTVCDLGCKNNDRILRSGKAVESIDDVILESELEENSDSEYEGDEEEVVEADFEAMFEAIPDEEEVEELAEKAKRRVEEGEEETEEIDEEERLRIEFKGDTRLEFAEDMDEEELEDIEEDIMPKEEFLSKIGGYDEDLELYDEEWNLDLMLELSDLNEFESMMSLINSSLIQVNGVLFTLEELNRIISAFKGEEDKLEVLRESVTLEDYKEEINSLLRDGELRFGFLPERDYELDFDEDMDEEEGD